MMDASIEAIAREAFNAGVAQAYSNFEEWWQSEVEVRTDHIKHIADRIAEEFPLVEVYTIYEDGDCFISINSEDVYDRLEYQKLLMDLSVNYLLKHNLYSIFFIYK